MLNLKFYPNEHYATITQVFTRLDGKSSHYDCLSGSGKFTVRLKFKKTLDRTKDEAKKIVYDILKKYVYDLDNFEVVEYSWRWLYERYVKVDEDNINNFEIVSRGKHTDHEVFEVNIFYIDEDMDAYRKLL